MKNGSDTLVISNKGAVRKRWLNSFLLGNEMLPEFTLPKNGGCLEEGIAIYTHDGVLFYLMSYIKDLDGLKKYIIELAEYRKTLYAEVDDEMVRLSDGKQISVNECRIDEDSYSRWT